MRSQRRAGAEYGTAARSPSELLEAVLNSRSIKVMATTEDKKQVVDQEATTAANEVAKKMRDKFKAWVDGQRACGRLGGGLQPPLQQPGARVFDGSHLSLPGVSLRLLPSPAARHLAPDPDRQHLLGRMPSVLARRLK